MVVICLPAASLIDTPQERIATPSIWTVQAPHCAMPQPYFVPVSPTFSRIAQSSGVSSSTSTLIVLPLIVRLAIAVPFISSIHRLNQDAMLLRNWSSSNQEYALGRRKKIDRLVLRHTALPAWQSCSQRAVRVCLL